MTGRGTRDSAKLMEFVTPPFSLATALNRLTDAAMHGLHLPRPAKCDSLPPVPSSSSAAPPNPHQPSQTSGHSTRRIPPRNFSELRAQARIVRGERKSPFLRKTTAGKERDLKELSVEQLSAMFERNARLLDSP